MNGCLVYFPRPYPIGWPEVLCGRRKIECESSLLNLSVSPVSVLWVCDYFGKFSDDSVMIFVNISAIFVLNFVLWFSRT